MNKKIAAAAVITAMTMLTACGEAAPAETTDTEAASVTLSETSVESNDTTTETSVETDELTETEPEISESETKNDSEVTNAEYSPEELGFDELEEPVLDDIEELGICDWEIILYDEAYNYVPIDGKFSEGGFCLNDTFKNVFDSKVQNEDVANYFLEHSYAFSECYADTAENTSCYIETCSHDLDKDGVDEMLVAVNYGVEGTVGLPGDFAIVDDGVVVLWGADTDANINRQNMGMYFTEDPVKTIGFNDVAEFTSIASYDFSVNSDNCFIGCEISNNAVINYYYQVTFNDGVYDLHCVKASGWVAHWNDDQGVYYRNTDIDYLD